MFINIIIILHENREHVPAVSTKYSHLAATPGAAYPPRLGLAYLGQYLGHILSKVYAPPTFEQCLRLRSGGSDVKTSNDIVIATFEQQWIQHSWYFIWISRTRCSETFSIWVHDILLFILSTYKAQFFASVWTLWVQSHIGHAKFSPSFLYICISCVKASK